jgi:hypothetical protein
MTIIVNGKSMTAEEYAEWGKARVRRLKAAGCDIVAGHAPAIETDSTLLARCFSSEPEWRRRQIALAAKRAGKCEEQAYDPTLADTVLDPHAMFEGRGDMQRRVESERRKNRDRGPAKPVHRLHPRLVQEAIQKMADKDPDVLRRDRRELVAEVTERHGSKG